jgi:hypothetical protein
MNNMYLPRLPPADQGGVQYCNAIALDCDAYEASCSSVLRQAPCKVQLYKHRHPSALCWWRQDFDNALKLAAGPAQRDVVYQEMGADAAANGDWKAAGTLCDCLFSLLQRTYLGHTSKVNNQL